MFKDESERIVAYTIEFYSLYPDVAFFFFFSCNWTSKECEFDYLSAFYDL